MVGSPNRRKIARRSDDFQENRWYTSSKRKATRRAKSLEGRTTMKPYIVKFRHVDEGVDGTLRSEEMYLCLHDEDRRGAFEKYLQVTGGEQMQNYFISVTGEDKIEAFWDASTWKFVTIPS
jgi:hypothetical protein